MMLALLASLLLFFFDTRLDYFKSVRSMMATVAYPVQAVAAMPMNVSDWFQDVFLSRGALREQIAVLEANNMLQSMRLQKLQSLERENMRLRELLGSSFRLQERVQVAELLRIDLDPFSQQVIIDKGRNEGVYVGQPVLDATGVMGQVMSTSRFSSRIVLLTDPSHSIPVQVNRNGLRGVVTGRGLGELLQLEYLSHDADVREGDLLVTSGLGGKFPMGYPVGRVVSVTSPQGSAFAEIKVAPAAKLGKSRELMLVIPGEKVQVEKDVELILDLGIGVKPTTDEETDDVSNDDESSITSLEKAEAVVPEQEREHGISD